MTRPPRDGELVAVECWCHSDIVWVPIERVREGLTGSCGLRACRKGKR